LAKIQNGRRRPCGKIASETPSGAQWVALVFVDILLGDAMELLDSCTISRKYVINNPKSYNHSTILTNVGLMYNRQSNGEDMINRMLHTSARSKSKSCSGAIW